MKKNKILTFSALAFLLIFTSCEQKLDESVKKVSALAQTMSVNTKGDAADDPAIWYNKQNPAESRIIGTNKKQGLGVYNLAGDLLSFTAVGKINNCDVQYNFNLGKDTFDIVGGSNRTNNAVSIFRYNEINAAVDSQALIHIPSYSEEIYGFCFYKNTETNELYTFSIGKDGLLEQYKIQFNKNKITADSVWSYRFDSQCEGLVADNKLGFLYVGEEDYGVWKLDLNQSNPQKELVMSLENNPNMQDDIEGITLYYSQRGYGYLIVSSQGNSTYAIFDRKPPHKYVGSFAIIDGKETDGTNHTDGIDVINLNLGKAFINGCFIAQDGKNITDGKKGNQNFKLVPWKDIALSFDPPLIIDNKYKGF